MHRFRNILVPIHGDPSKQTVLARACRLAKQNGARVKLIAIVEDLPWYTRLVLPNAEELQTLLVREKSEELEGLAEGLRSEGIDNSVKVLRGRRHLEMVREVLRGEHDLLMKEAEPNESVLFGSTDMHLLRACPCPVWLFKPEHAGRNFAQVLAAVDPAPPPDEADLLHLKAEVAPKDAALDAKILDLAGLLADNEGAELHVVHAWSAPGEALVWSEVALAQEQVEQLPRRHASGGPKSPRTARRRGPPTTGPSLSALGQGRAGGRDRRVREGAPRRADRDGNRRPHRHPRSPDRQHGRDHSSASRLLRLGRQAGWVRIAYHPGRLTMSLRHQCEPPRPRAQGRSLRTDISVKLVG